jgi:tetratricopeptide (TPR) repeat protein
MSWKNPVVLGAAAVVLIAGGLAVGWALMGRPASGPAGTTTGGPGVSPQLAALQREVEREDAPIPALLAFAHQALDEQQLSASIWAYKRVLAREPKNPEALVHMGTILAMAGHMDQALANMAEALRVDPKYAHAYWDRGHLLVSAKQDYKGAIADFQAFLEIIPTGQDADRARAMIAEAQRLAATPPAAGASPPGATTPRATSSAGAAAAPPHPPGRGGAPSAAPGTAASPASPSGGSSGTGAPETFTFKSLGEMRKGMGATGGS